MGLDGAAAALLTRGVVGLQRHHQREVDAGGVCRVSFGFRPTRRALHRADQLRITQPGHDRAVITHTGMAPGAVGLGQQGGAGVPQPQLGAAKNAVEHAGGIGHDGWRAARVAERPAQRAKLVTGHGIG